MSLIHQIEFFAKYGNTFTIYVASADGIRKALEHHFQSEMDLESWAYFLENELPTFVEAATKAFETGHGSARSDNERVSAHSNTIQVWS